MNSFTDAVKISFGWANTAQPPREIGLHAYEGTCPITMKYTKYWAKY